MDRPRTQYARSGGFHITYQVVGDGPVKRGYELDFGVGIAFGYATLGEIGFEGRSDYAAIGLVTNLAARLCDEASGGQILINQRTLAEIEEDVQAEEVGVFTLKGFARPIPAYNVVQLRG